MIKNKIVLGVVTACVAASMALGLAACSSHEHVWDEGTPDPDDTATCQHAGTMIYKCEECGETKTEKYLGDHSWGEGTVTKAATCGEDGIMTYTCSVCRKTKTETIDATGEHVWTNDTVADDADPDEIGWTTTLAAEYHADGLETRTCLNCGKVEERAIPALGLDGNDDPIYNEDHDYSEAVYYDAAVEGSSVITEAGWYITCNHYGCGYVKKLDSEEGVTYLVGDSTTLSSALSSASSFTETSIKLTDDIEVSSALTISADSEVTIDLNSKALTTAQESGNSLITVNGTLSLTDSSRNGTGSVTYDAGAAYRPIEVASNGTLTIDAGTYTGELAVVVRSGATATISGGTFVGTEASTDNVYATIQSQGETTITGGTFTSASGAALYTFGSGASITVKGGTFTVEDSCAAQIGSGASMTIGETDGNNGDIAITSNGGNGVEVVGGTLTVNSGTIKALGTEATAIGLFNSTETASITINGGTITGKMYGVTTDGLLTTADLASVTINGGTISGGVTAVYLAANGTYAISGGNIKGAVGVEIRAGSLTISGGTITGSSRTFELANDGAGNASGPAVNSGVGLAIVQHTTKLAISVTVTSGTITGYYAVYQADLQNNGDDAGEVKVSINESNAEGATNDAVLKGNQYLEISQTEDSQTEEGDGSDVTEGDVTDGTDAGDND